MLSDRQVKKLRDAFQRGTVRVRSVSPEGQLEWKRVTDVRRVEVPWETILEGRTTHGTFVLTAGHRVFNSPTEKTEMGDLHDASPLLSVLLDDQVSVQPFFGHRELPKRQFMYDLTVEDWHNFVLHRSRVVISNCPDKFYHFRPPEHEGRIGKYDRVFGQIWEDEELLEYLERGLDWFNMFPPMTQNLNTIDLLVQQMPHWRTAILWQAIIHACFALNANWVADEFDYSIGGISLTLERSSKYEALKQSAEQQFDKATEAKQRTVKFIKGLQQPRHGIGVRSAFGPHVGRGILSPRRFM